jgi:phosphoglycolate phosphatase
MVNSELLIFDLDGTIADSQQDLASSVNHVRALYGLTSIDLYTLRTYIGDGIVSLMERAMPGLTKADRENAIGQFRAYYRAHLLATTKLYPDVKKVLRKYAGLKKAVLTNKVESLSRELLNGLGILDQFAVVWGGDTGPRRKPDPEPVLRIIARLNVDKERSIMIGDGPNDIIAAKNAGIRSVAVTYGYSNREELSKLHPDFMIDSLTELAKIID